MPTKKDKKEKKVKEEKEDDSEEEVEEKRPPPKAKKSAPVAADSDESEEEVAEKKKKKKGKSDGDDLSAMFGDSKKKKAKKKDDDDDEEEKEEKKEEKKEKKKGKDKEEEKEPEKEKEKDKKEKKDKKKQPEEREASPPPKKEPPPPAKPAAKAEVKEEVVDAKTAAKNKKKEKKKAEDDDFDALLGEFKDEAPAAASSAPAPAAPVEDGKTPANKKKDKKKAAQAAKAADDDEFAAALGEFKDTTPAAASTDAPAEAAAAADEDKEDGDGGEEVVDAKTLANRKKKEKKKAAQAKKTTGGEGMWGASAADADTQDKGDAPAASSGAAEEKAEPAPKAEPKSKAEAKKGAKKESAIVKAARERMEAERKLEEERLAFEAEQRRIQEEEDRKIAEEEARVEAEREAKRQAKLAKIARQKEEGTYRTKKQKEYEKRAAMLREQFGFGKPDDEEEEAQPAAAAAAAPEKKAGGKVTKEQIEEEKKKKLQRKQEKEEAERKAKEEEEAKAKAAAEEEARKKKEEEEAKKKAEEEEDDAGWEDLAADEDEEEEAKGKKDEGEEEDEDTEDEESSDDESGSSSGSSSSSDLGYRSPIIVIMGHVDTGKTKLLDKIRRTNVQEGEAGGITQQIGATFFPSIALVEQTRKVDPEFDIEVPGIMIIDTPGHESFNNLRARGSSLCDMAILVIDIMHGLEPQTVESLEMLKKRRCPFIIALNKIDVCYQWNSENYTSIRSALDRQEQFVRDEFQQRLGNVMLQLNERGLNVSLYWENEDPRSTVSIVPTSALTGEGVPDLLFQLLNLTQTLMGSKLEVKEELQCTVIEVKNIEGLGTTIDVVLVNGTLREGDQIVIAGMNGPIVTTIRALLTPKPMKEMRVKGEYIHHPQISMSMGVKICAPGLDEAVAGTELYVVGPDDDVEELKEEVDEGFESILAEFEKQPEGVYVKASTLGSLEALLSFLSDMKIPVFEVGIGEVHKKDVKKAAIMKEKKKPEFAVILCFDVKVNTEAMKQAKEDDVQIMTADIIYHLFDKFTAYMQKVQESKKTETRAEAVFPVILQIDKQYIFHKTDPMVFGCNVVGGQLRIGTPICVPEKENLPIGHVGGIEKDHKPIQVAKRGDTVCVKIEQNTAQTHILYGRHFDYTNQLYSLITRQSIDTLKEHFKDEMKKDDWELIIAMKKVFNIQ